MSTENEFRSGFVAIVGRPNTGKSTLVNALVGSKVVITSPHPNTTRHAIRGIVNEPDFQAILVDTPGVHKPKTLLGKRLNAVVEESLDSVDVIIICLPADEESGAGDQYIIDEITKLPNITKYDFKNLDLLPNDHPYFHHIGNVDYDILLDRFYDNLTEMLILSYYDTIYYFTLVGPWISTFLYYSTINNPNQKLIDIQNNLELITQ
jgi:small GTP-binding protein